MEDKDYKKEYFIEDLHDQQMHLLTETEEGFRAGGDAAALNITPNSGIGILKTMNEDCEGVYEMFVFVTDEVESYFARIFQQQSVGQPFSKEEIANYIDRMNGASGTDSKALCRPF